MSIAKALGWARVPRYLWAGLPVLLLIVVGALVIPRLSSGQSRRGQAGAFAGPQPVQAVTAIHGNIPVILSALGTVTPLASVTVQSQISGQLVKLGFTEGQMVKRGDFLAQIDPRPYEVALAQAQGQFTRDAALLHQAQSDLARYQALEAEHYMSAQQITDEASLAQQYQGAVQSDQAEVDGARLNLTYCHIVAPVSGRVGLRQVNLGNYVQVASPNGIVVITELTPISVLFSLPQEDVTEVMQRMSSGAHLQAVVYDSTNTRQLATGVLSAVDNQMNTTTGTVQMRAVFDNQNGRLFPNEFVNLQLLVNTVKNAVVVPVAAVQRGVPGTFVYVVNANDTASLRKVTLGAADGERVAIAAGLNAGERVVTDGAEQLRDGARIMLPKSAGSISVGANNDRVHGARGSGYARGSYRRRTAAPTAATH